ncbi:hypothetical protein HYN48_04870 [Flavobacterium magnum]|uniref:Uncharacterized protein n=1 Tax=Flavobacterium magnum TaxID=2162713 RepID=A0A2S0RCJ3_9FLAO|nr:hypothetical protein HYN48_04870 [Flavobacterium magnum]
MGNYCSTVRSKHNDGTQAAVGLNTRVQIDAIKQYSLCKADNPATTAYFFIKKLLILYFKKLSLHSEKTGVFYLLAPEPK